MGLEQDFKNKRILVTGGSRGIGKAITIALVNLGGNVTVLGKNASNLSKLVSEYPSISTICVDISKWEETRSLLQDKSFDYLVNNAGISQPLTATFLEVTPEVFDMVMNTNLKSVLNVSQSVVKNMIQNGVKGSIVNISSFGSRRPLPFSGVYSCSKAGLDMLTKVMAAELGCHGIRVNSVNPGGLETDLMTDLTASVAEMGEEAGKKMQALLGRMSILPNGSPMVSMDSVVASVLFLLSDAAKSVTGTGMVVDNGFIAS